MILDVLNAFGQARLDDDYQTREQFSGDRGRRGDRLDFATGWIACAARHNMQAYFTDEAKARLFAVPAA